MRYLKLFFLFIFLSGSAIFAQNSDILLDLSQPSQNGGVVVMEQDSSLASLIALQREVNMNKGGVDGFSIRLYRGNAVATANDGAQHVKAQFLLKYPDKADEVYVEYVQPNFFVRVGDYKSYGEALKMRNELEMELPEIKDDIYIIPSLVKIKSN